MLAKHLLKSVLDESFPHQDRVKKYFPLKRMSTSCTYTQVPLGATRLPRAMDAAWDPTLQTEDGDEYCWSELQLAARSGDIEAVKGILSKDPSAVNEPAHGYYGQTALIAACMQGHEAVVKALLAAGADVHFSEGNNFQRNALQIACGQGFNSIIDILLDAGAEVNSSPGHTISASKAKDIPHAGQGGPSVTRYNGRTALQAASERGHLEVVKKLLDLGADVNAQASPTGGRTALQAAACHGQTAIVRLLLDSGADVNASAARYAGFTALQAACFNGDAALVKLFLDIGADMYAIGGGYRDGMALHAAAQSGSVEIVQQLIDAGCDVNVCSPRRGQTALQSAVLAAHDGVEALLRRNGAVGKVSGGIPLFKL